MATTRQFEGHDAEDTPKERAFNVAILAGEAETPSYETVYTTGYTWIDVATSGYTWQEVRIER